MSPTELAAASTSVQEVTKLLLKSGRNKEYDVVVPPASLTIRQIQEQIPTKYFERPAWRSLQYLARDLAQLFLTYGIMYFLLVPLIESVEVAAATTAASAATSALPIPFLATSLAWIFKVAVWSLFWFVQGLNGTALWVLSHECGHQAFSCMKGLNDAIGFSLHSMLLVPYHSWRITHGTHHKHTNHLKKDLVFVPVKQDRVMEIAEEAPLVLLFNWMVMFLLGWPGHLLFNASGQELGAYANHFNPFAPFFRREEYGDVVASVIGVVTMLSAICCSVYRFGIVNVFCWYIMPYLWVNFWLVFITFLQHTDIRIPHYTHEHWTFPRGAISAVDRDFGWILNEWLHHINDSHVVHHLFSQMPHYNAIEVTRKYMRKILGDVYITDKQPLWKALLLSTVECRYVVPSDGICVFRK